ncbi:MAG TPA: DinB family protein [Anaerolineales bacterium]|nr:DinB family protein [Anaerolineales bacterium]
MFNPQLQSAVQEFATLVLPLTEKELEREWIWKDHDEEGIRFAFFVTLQELRDLAVTLAASCPKPTAAQHILSQYHAAFMDLQAVLLGVSNKDAERAPSEGEWSVQRAYAHIVGTDINFTIVVRYALERHRAGTWSPKRYSDEEADRLAGISDEEYLALIKGPLDRMVAYDRHLHHQIIEEFSTITDDELSLPSTFWEETRFPIRHRLHRYESHFVQHAVQIDKTLAAIGQPPSESKQLLRKIFAALAEAEGFMIGAEKMDETAILATASSISKRNREIKNLL